MNLQERIIRAFPELFAEAACIAKETENKGGN